MSEPIHQPSSKKSLFIRSIQILIAIAGAYAIIRKDFDSSDTKYIFTTLLLLLLLIILIAAIEIFIRKEHKPLTIMSNVVGISMLSFIILFFFTGFFPKISCSVYNGIWVKQFNFSPTPCKENGGDPPPYEGFIIPDHLRPGLFSRYLFNGNIQDSFPSNTPARPYHLSTFTDSLFGQALVFNQENQRLEIPNLIGSFNGNKSIILIIKVNGILSPSYGCILDKTRGSGYKLKVENEQLIIEVKNLIGSGYASDTTLIDIGEWEFIAITKRDNFFKLFRNDDPPITITPEGGYEPNNDDLIIGGAGTPYTSDHNIIADLDELLVYSRALDDSEIEELYRVNEQKMRPNSTR